MLRVLTMVDDIVCEEGNRQEDKHPGQDGYQDKCEVRVPLNPDKRSCAAGRVSGIDYVHQINGCVFLASSWQKCHFFQKKSLPKQTFFLSSFHPVTQKQCYPPLGWSFHGVSRTALWQDGDSKKIA
jgi:hypothetical protein